MNAITPELRQAMEPAGDTPVEITDPQTNAAYYLVRADVYERLRQLQEEDDDRREKDAWAKLGCKALSEWAQENPF